MKQQRWGWVRVALLALAGLPACGDTGGERGEILRELQALRSTIADGQRGTRGHDFDRQQLDAALQPLRELLQGVVADQVALRDRQGNLAAELGRWSALVAAGATPEAKDELGALRARLEKMEQELHQQDARHRDVQDLLRKALDTTADRLEGFLDRLEGKGPPANARQPAGAPATPPDKGSVGPAAPAETAGHDDHGKPAATGSDPYVRQGYERKSPGGETLTIVLLGIGIVAAALLAWRLWREGAAQRQHAGAPARREEPRLVPAAEPTTGWDAVELLAASLADHVERVENATRVVERAQQAAARPEPVAAAGSETEGETIVVADEDEAVWQLLGVPGHGGGHREQAAVAAAAVPCAEPVAEGPVWIFAEVAADGELAARACLQREARVLRRPAPVFTNQGDRLRVEVAVLSSLPGAERTQILQRLHRSAPPQGKNGSRQGASL